MPSQVIVVGYLVLIVPVVVVVMVAAEIPEEEGIRDGEKRVGIGPVAVPRIGVVEIRVGRVAVGLRINVGRAAGVLVRGVDRDGLLLRLIAVLRSHGRELVLG